MKRLFDIFLSFIGLLLLSPILLLIAILVKLSSKGTVFFTQIRIGKNFKPFKLYKFRSMIISDPKAGLPITSADDPRITKIGKILRKTKLDEIPQLLNVLIGDMSFVGPRPEVEKYISLFKNEYRIILSIKPGITDYAAIEFSNEEQILKKYSNPEEGYIKEILPKKIELYKKYLNDYSFKGDIKIIFATIYKILKK